MSPLWSHDRICHTRITLSHSGRRRVIMSFRLTNLTQQALQQLLKCRQKRTQVYTFVSTDTYEKATKEISEPINQHVSSI